MNKREFTFSDGKSDKFWNIEIDRNEFSVRYGKSGTTGQTQLKSFDSDEAARKAADKLIAEKTKKGYVENTGNAGAPASAQPVARVAAKPAKVEAAKVEAPEVEVTAPSLGLDELKLDAPRDLGLEPRDYGWATWRPRVVLERPTGEAPEFDKDEALARLAKLPGKQAYNEWNWSKAQIAENISREEAHFWLTAMMTPLRYDYRSQVSIFQIEYLPKLEKQAYDGKIGLDSVVKRFSKTDDYNWRHLDPLLVKLLARLFAPLEVVEFALKVDENARNSKNQSYHHTSYFVNYLIEGFRHNITPYLAEEEWQGAREMLRPHLGIDKYETAPIPFYLAAQLGLHDELFALVRSWNDDRFADFYYYHGTHRTSWCLDWAAPRRSRRRCGG